uniref:TAFII28 domain-containing protein n=2 Tax=Caenorhabditis tropicalis TaxID=1561998 RepID=A0A1I7TM44_9PELO
MDAADIMTNVLPSSSGQHRRMETTGFQKDQSASTIQPELRKPYIRTPLTIRSSTTSFSTQMPSKNQSSFMGVVNQNGNSNDEINEENQTILNELLLGNFSKAQYDRFIAFRRSKFTRSVVKNIITEVTGRSTNDPIAVAVAGLAKLFVGELVEAVELRNASNQQNRPVQPQHIKSAFNNKLALFRKGTLATIWDQNLNFSCKFKFCYRSLLMSLINE